MSQFLALGVDVSKATLDLASYPDSVVASYPNDPAGHAELVAFCQLHPVSRIVLEATGGYENAVAAALAGAGLPVVVVNARHIRHFAKAAGHSAKTDRIDAQVLAWFGATIKPPVRPLADTETRELAAMVQRRRQLLEMIQAEGARLEHASGKVRARIEAHIEWLESELDDANEGLAAVIKSSPVWCDMDALLRSVPGVGPVLSSTLIADLPELGSVSGREIAALVGVAPFARDSGTQRGKRVIWGGRSEIRRTLYMATLACLTHNPPIKAYYRQLKERGKPSKVAMVACMRKLIVTLNSMASHNTAWAPA